MPRRDHGFTLLELLVGLALSMLLAAAVAPLWVALEKAGSQAADCTVWLVQERVAAARFEHDLRTAGAEGCHFPTSGAILQASPTQIVLLSRRSDGPGTIIVEWEIAKGSLMRRWGPCPLHRPDTYAHALYTDHKAILEEVSMASSFAYKVDGVVAADAAAETDLASIQEVLLVLRPERSSPAAPDGSATTELTVTARVGR